VRARLPSRLRHVHDLPFRHPVTGTAVANRPSTETSSAAGAYAVTKGNMNTVSQYYAGDPITGLIKI
jgi:hypothetical protein